MTDRMQESHAAPIDLPLALFGIGLGADVLGRIVGSPALRKMARYAVPAAATAAAFATAGGFGNSGLAGGRGPAVKSRRPRSTLPMATAAAALAAWRWRRTRASVPYLALGLAAIGAIARSGNGTSRRLERTVGTEGADGPVVPREPPSAQVAAAVRTEAADKLRGL